MIAYELVSRHPFNVKECTVGTGAACGAIYLHQNFEKLLHQLLGSRGPEILTPRRLAEAVKNFEGNIKIYFDPFDEDCEDEYEIPLPGAPDIPSIGLVEGFITLSKYDPISLF